MKVLRLAKWMSLCSRVSLLLERDTFVRREVAARSRAGGQVQQVTLEAGRARRWSSASSTGSTVQTREALSSGQAADISIEKRWEARRTAGLWATSRERRELTWPSVSSMKERLAVWSGARERARAPAGKVYT